MFVFPEAFEKQGRPVASYAFPLYLIGTAFLFCGMLYGAIIIERSSEEYEFRPIKPSKIYWLQPGNQNVGDQVFNAFLAVKEGSSEAGFSKKKKMEYVKSKRVRKYDGRSMEIYSTVLFTILGFIFQFIGLRGLHASVILAQLGSTFVMTVLRTCLRTERMTPNENKFRGERDRLSHKQQELDCFAFHLENVETFTLMNPSSSYQSLSTESSLEDLTLGKETIVEQVIETRTRLAELTSTTQNEANVAWDDLPIRMVAQKLAETINLTMDQMSSWGVDFGTSFQFKLPFECMSSLSEWSVPAQGVYLVEVVREGDVLRWKVDVNELEAIIGLWTWSLYKSDTKWHHPRRRLVGLNQGESVKKETYRYFHKWIFRQRDARVEYSHTIDTPDCLLGIGTGDCHGDNEILVMTTENDLEVMAAQNIYTRFLFSVVERVDNLATDVDLIPGLQNSFIAQNSHVNDLVYCFESCSLGSREDALLCIIPVLKDRNILPKLSADSANIRKHIEDLVKSKDWSKAFRMIEWICQRSDGAEFEYSLYELGNLCRRALLDTDKAVQQTGLACLFGIFGPDIREEFLRTQRIKAPWSWSVPLDDQQIWSSFQKQMGWLAWRISRNIPGMDWIQAALKTHNAPDNLEMLFAAQQDTRNPVVGAHAIEEWLTLNHTKFEREFGSTEDTEGYAWALHRGCFALLYFLLERWIEMSSDCPTLIEHAICVTARNGSEWGIELLQKRSVDIDATTPYNVSALMEVVVAEDFEAAQLLLTHGANPNGNDAAPDKRPLTLAAHLGLTNIAELLVRHGATVDILDPHGTSPLYMASIQNHFDTVRMLASYGADLNIDINGRPLHASVTQNRIEMVELLLELGADMNAPERGSEQTPLMVAARSPNPAFLKLLLTKGAGIHATVAEMMATLENAKQYGELDNVAILEACMN